ncbi:MAG: SDR family oxidoreductase [Acidobacteriota bacterium]|nr:SDR family oxidoreductase [Acidobacteriota bacterium]
MDAPDRVVLVTGASSGIGSACALYLAARGYRVYGASRSGTCDAPVEPLAMDVTVDGSVEAAVNHVFAREGRIDIVVNNAGISMAGAVEDTSLEEARAQFEVNFFGVLRVCRAVLPILRARRAGYLVNVGSIGGLVAVPFHGLYSASKFAIEGVTESLRMEAGPLGVRVVLIEPGDHRTALTARRQMTAESQTNPAYRERFRMAAARMAQDEQNGPAPEAVARLLHKIVNNPRPRLRYTVGPVPERAAVWLKRLAPYSMVEKAMRFYYFR